MIGEILRNLRTASLAVVLVAVALVPARAAQAQSIAGSVEGTVVGMWGRPIPHVDITIPSAGKSAISGEDGTFLIPVLLPGAYRIDFHHIGFMDRSMTVLIEPGVIASVKTALQTQDQRTARRFRVGSFRRHDDDGPFASATVDRQEIIKRSSKTTAEALREEPGVFVQKTGHGGGSANLRGFSSNQILLLVDGIRLNNSTYRLGNHQYLTTVDPFALDRLEVYYGPNSVAFGTDALGGAINSISFSPRLVSYPGKSKTVLSQTFRYATIDNESSGHMRGSYESNRLAVTVGLSAKSFGHLKRGTQGPNPAIENATNGTQQFPTAFDAWDTDLKLLMRPAEEHVITAAYQRSEQIEVPRYDKYENEGFHRWIYDPQIRELGYVRYAHYKLRSEKLSSLALTPRTEPHYQLTVSRNRQVEGRRIQADPASEITHERDGVTTWGVSAEARLRVRGHHTTLAGADFYSDLVESGRQFETPGEAPRLDAQGRFPNESTYRSGGIFVLEKFRLFHSLDIEAGLRYSHFRAAFSPQDSTLLVPGSEEVVQTFDALSGSIGASRRIRFDSWNNVSHRVFGSVATAFRAPNLSDITKLGESKGTTFEVPNYNLDPEEVINYELGLSGEKQFWRGRYSQISWGITGFYSDISNTLASTDTTFAGESFVIVGGDTLSVRTKENQGDANVRGTTLSLEVREAAWTVRTSATFMRGENTTIGEPLGGIPPHFGNASVMTNDLAGPGGRLALTTRWARGQYRLSADDKDDPRIPGGTPGWTIWHVRYSRGISEMPGKPILVIGLENILDRNYREHGSGVNGPGRSLAVSLTFRGEAIQGKSD